MVSRNSNVVFAGDDQTVTVVARSELPGLIAGLQAHQSRHRLSRTPKPTQPRRSHEGK